MNTSAVKKKEVISEYETNELFAKFHSGDMDARSKLIEEYCYLVHIIVRKKFKSKYRNSHEYQELYSEGILGLIDAIDKFDENHNAKFSTYANYRIWGSIYDFLKSNNRVYVPASARKKAYEVVKVLEASNCINRRESFNNICKSLGYNPVSIENTLQALNVNLSVDTLISDENPFFDESIIISGVEYDDTNEILWRSFLQLDERELEIVRQYYYEDIPMPRIAKSLGVTAPRISQMHAKILSKLKKGFK
jgi:RNA polymerase sigma factor for flagellar operon FliA